MRVVHRRDAGGEPADPRGALEGVEPGLIEGKKIKQWVFYRRDEERIAVVKEMLNGDW